MANLTISDAPSLTGSASASGDLFPVVDVSASEGSKGHKITRDELGDAMLRTAAVVAALGGKAATSHSHSAATTGADGFMSSADKAKLDGLVNPVTPGVLYVTTSGNDTTGNGSFNKPYLTAQKAFDVAFAATGVSCLIYLGIGSFSINPSSTWLSRIRVVGCGPLHTTLVITTSNAVTLTSDKSVFCTILATASAETGNDGPSIRLRGVIGDIVITSGAQGIPGLAGDPGDSETPGGNGGNGGPGGNGGSIDLIDCSFGTVFSGGGSGGTPGIGGADGGAGAGSPGSEGSSGSRGNIYADACHIGELTCTNYSISRTNITTVVEGSVGSDFGGNSTAPSPF